MCWNGSGFNKDFNDVQVALDGGVPEGGAVAGCESVDSGLALQEDPDYIHMAEHAG